MEMETWHFILDGMRPVAVDFETALDWLKTHSPFIDITVSDEWAVSTQIAVVPHGLPGSTRVGPYPFVVCVEGGSWDGTIEPCRTLADARNAHYDFVMRLRREDALIAREVRRRRRRRLAARVVVSVACACLAAVAVRLLVRFGL